jgi:hypothetical protein
MEVRLRSSRVTRDGAFISKHSKRREASSDKGFVLVRVRSFGPQQIGD